MTSITEWLEITMKQWDSWETVWLFTLHDKNAFDKSLWTIIMRCKIFIYKLLLSVVENEGSKSLIAIRSSTRIFFENFYKKQNRLKKLD